MTSKVNLDTLRKRAEKALSGAAERISQFDTQASPNLQELVQELQIYQSELEIQNQELVESQIAEAKASEKYRALFQGSPLPALLCDAQGLIVEANEASLSFLGLRPASIQQRYSFIQFVDIGSRGSVKKLINPPTQEPLPYLRIKIKARKGDYRDCEIRSLQAVSDENGLPLTLLVLIDKHLEEALVCANRETTEALAKQQELNQKLEETRAQLFQAEKMAAIGQLSAGLAHELNNPLGFITSNHHTLADYVSNMLAIFDVCDELDRQPQESKLLLQQIRNIKREKDFDFMRNDIMQLLGDSHDGLKRLSSIVVDMKNFARPGDDRWLKTDLHQNIDSTLNIIWNELKYKVTLRKEYSPLPEIVCLPSQLNQVFFNLLINAGQAIETKGEIVIRTRHEGSQVCVEISDSGCGIKPENLNRIFEPFFTTKPPGKGTGLGLMVCYGIVERHAGHIDVSSTPGQGSTFAIWLPVSQPDTIAAASTKESS